MKLPTHHVVSRLLMLGLGAALLPLAAMAASVDPASLVAKADIAKLLGQPAPPAQTIGPELDENTGAVLAFCTYQTETAAVIISVLTFPSPQEALAKTASEIVPGLEGEDGAQVAEETGLGDRAFWGIGEKGASLIVVKGIHVVGIGIGGKLPKPPESYRQTLLKLAGAALTKI